MPYLSSPTLTKAEQEALLRVSSGHPRDHLIFSLALGTGLRLAEIVGLNVGDVFTADGKPRGRIRVRREIAKGGRAGDVFLPDALRLRGCLTRIRSRPEGPASGDHRTCTSQRITMAAKFYSRPISNCWSPPLLARKSPNTR